MFKILPQKIKLGNYFPPDSRRQPETLQLWLIYDDVNNLTYYLPSSNVLLWDTSVIPYNYKKVWRNNLLSLSVFFFLLKNLEILYSVEKKS